MKLEDCMAAIIDYRGKTPTKTTTGIPLITAKIVKGGYPPDLQDKAVQTVLQQAEALSTTWALG